jgi:ribosome-associated protein
MKKELGRNSKALATFAADIALGKKAKDIKMFNAKSATPIADYFVLASCESRPQLKATMTSIVEEAKKGGERVHYEGVIDSGWVIIDFGSVVVHLMNEEIRDYYNLDELWGSAAMVYHM